MTSNTNYLSLTKQKVDEAIAVAEANVRPESEIDLLLTEASKNACEALLQICDDDAFWKKIEYKPPTLMKAFEYIIKGRNSDGSPHYTRPLVPLTGAALRKFGYKPPEQAEAVVLGAFSACAAIREDSIELPKLVADAKRALRKLADVTCALALELRKKQDSEIKRKKWRDRAVSLLKWVSITIGAAMIGHVIDSATLKDLSEYGKAAICIASTHSIKDCSQKGVDKFKSIPFDDI